MSTAPRIFFFLALCFSLNSCLYKMPKEDEYQSIPTTNNPHVIRDMSPSHMPGVEY